MAQLIFMSYNIRHMNRMFSNNQIPEKHRKRAEQIAAVITAVNPHLLGICEAANAPEEHQYFIEHFLPASGYQVAQGVSRGAQNLVYYYRDPITLVSVDEALSFYEPWASDIDDDGVVEQFQWDRKPLEAVFSIAPAGRQVRVILVHTKSKGVFSVADLYHYEKIALASRKRLVGQGSRLRERLDALLNDAHPLPVVVMGDMNDGPGLDPYELLLGRSFVETVMGSVFDAGRIFHNALWWMSLERGKKDDLWTVDFPDPIVNNPFGMKHRVWIDHLLVSPDMLREDNPVKLVMRSGSIGEKSKAAREASDHFPIYATIEVA